MISLETKEMLEEIQEARNLGNFQTIKKLVGEERLIEFLNTVYPKFSLPEIEQITGIPDSTLQRWFRELDIPLTRAHISNIAMPGNEDSEVIITKDSKSYKVSTIKITPELSYVIGFILGDGSTEKYDTEAFNRNLSLRQPILEILQKYGVVTEKEREDGLWKLRLSGVVIANLIKNENGIRYDTVNFILDR